MLNFTVGPVMSDIFGGIYKNDFPEYCPICRRAYEHQKHKHAQDQRYEEDKNEAMYILYGVERG